jgi:hypothetical protein
MAFAVSYLRSDTNSRIGRRRGKREGEEEGRREEMIVVVMMILVLGEPGCYDTVLKQGHDCSLFLFVRIVGSA